MKLPHSHGVQWELSRFIFGFALSRVSGRMTLAVSFKARFPIEINRVVASATVEHRLNRR